MTLDGTFLWEIFVVWIGMRFLGTSVYKKFADGLQLQGKEHVLDFGCGLGTVACYTAPLLSEGRLVCADISPKRLDQCRKNLKQYANVECRDTSGSQVPFQDETFDVIYCHFVLHEIKDAELAKTLENLYRGLKPQGKLVFREPVKDNIAIRHMDVALQGLGLARDSSRITDIPLMGTVIEGTYRKEVKF